jgi:hypothetical protein
MSTGSSEPINLKGEQKILPPEPAAVPTPGSPPGEDAGGASKGAADGGDIGGYCFTLSATITQTFIGEIPGGFRVDLQYDPAKALRFDGPSSLSTAERKVLKGAELLTGTDWVTVSSDGIATFNTRVTLQVGPVAADETDDRCVLSLNIRGRADLGDLRRLDGTPLLGGARTDIIPAWLKGFEAKSFVPVAFSATFEIPTEGDTPAQDKIYGACRSLEQRLFLAVGRANYLSGPNSPLDSIRLDFIGIKVPSFALESDKERKERRDKLRAAAVPKPAVDGDSGAVRATT